MPHSPAETIRVLLIDDHAVVRSGLRLLLEARPGFHVVGEAGDRSTALALANKTQPEIILLDLTLPGTSGLDLIPELLAAAAESRIIILTGVLDPEAHTHAVAAGARGVVLKEKAPEVLVKAIEKVHDGEVWLDRSAVARLVDARQEASRKAARHDPEETKIASLTGREREIITLIGCGFRNKQIAARLFISEGTVRNHLTTVFSKLEVADRMELLMYAYRHGLAKPLL